MASITKPPVRHPSLPKNALGLTKREYEGAMSTLCAGCGHDSVTAALVQTLWELDLPPHRAAKMSGIGCSSKTTAYFLRQSHGFNGVMTGEVQNGPPVYPLTRDAVPSMSP